MHWIWLRIPKCKAFYIESTDTVASKIAQSQNKESTYAMNFDPAIFTIYGSVISHYTPGSLLRFGSRVARFFLLIILSNGSGNNLLLCALYNQYFEVIQRKTVRREKQGASPSSITTPVPI